jgi:hypothetical protein
MSQVFQLDGLLGNVYMGGATVQQQVGHKGEKKFDMGHHNAATVSYSVRNGVFLQSQGGPWPIRPTPLTRPMRYI